MFQAAIPVHFRSTVPPATKSKHVVNKAAAASVPPAENAQAAAPGWGLPLGQQEVCDFVQETVMRTLESDRCQLWIQESLDQVHQQTQRGAAELLAAQC